MQINEKRWLSDLSESAQEAEASYAGGDLQEVCDHLLNLRDDAEKLLSIIEKRVNWDDAK